MNLAVEEDNFGNICARYTTFGREIIWAQCHMDARTFERCVIWARNTCKRTFDQRFVSFFKLIKTIFRL